MMMMTTTTIQTTTATPPKTSSQNHHRPSRGAAAHFYASSFGGGRKNFFFAMSRRIGRREKKKSALISQSSSFLNDDEEEFQRRRQRQRGRNKNAMSKTNALSSSSSSSSSNNSNSNTDFDDRVEEASMAVERAEELAAQAEAKLKALDVKLSSSSSDDDDDENEEKSSSRVQELKKSLEEMKQANLELRKKKGKAASSSSSSSSSKSSSSTPVSRLAAIEREEKEEEEKKKGVANNADVDNTNNFGGGSQRRLYDQMLTLRTRLNERVASSNAFAKYLEKTLLTRDDDLKRANELLYGAAKESGELLRLIRDAQNDIAKSGDDPTRRARGEQKLEKFVNRLQLVESTLTKNAKEIDSTVVRTVPVEYHGIASDVIMMGDFDGWTRGIQLYPSFVEGGSSTFTGEARLPPGTYLVKFKVDGEWRLAREWPSSGEGFDANNVLTVM
jgi:myosin heavy subunit